MPEDLVSRWQEWKQSLKEINQLEIPRTYGSDATTSSRELHVFGDASEKGIAAVGYLRTTSQVSFVLGKTKLSPKHATTMPRMELCAAVLAVELGSFINRTLGLPIDTTTYYSDSKVTLGYIQNRTRRFFIYVSNRVQRILSQSKPEQWNYVPTQHNPADLGTRRVAADELMDSVWLSGPKFLHDTHGEEIAIRVEYGISDTDAEVRPEISVHKTTIENRDQKGKESLGSARFSRFSTWIPLVRGVARLRRRAAVLVRGKQSEDGLNADDLDQARKLILIESQWDSFADDITALREGGSVSNSSGLATLDPFLDSDGLLRVGGRLQAAEVGSLEKHPVIISKSHHIATLLVRHHHNASNHQGCHITEGAIRTAGYWIIGGKRLVSSIIHKCVTCRKLRGKLENQKMADMPSDRLDPGPPFSNVGVDTFGPWQVSAHRTRGGQAQSKRWAILFTCLTTRAVHIEVVEELSTSCFINALRRFYAIRGTAKIIRSDAGTNFTGAANILDKYLAENGTRWIFNPPHASHFGGVWERMIGISRRILDAILQRMTDKLLTHEVLTTLLAEVSAIINARPLTAVSTDPAEPTLLTPAMLLTQRIGSEHVSPQNLDVDVDSDRTLYLAHWKKVQALAEAFWRRWRVEYLATLQARRKWTDSKRNIGIGDIVLLKDKDSHRNDWPMAIVSKVIPSTDGLIRKVEVQDCRRHVFFRPVHELVLLVEKHS